MRKLLASAALTGLRGAALHPASASAQYYERDRSEPASRYERDGFGWMDGHERFARDRFERDAFERGYRMGRAYGERRGERDDWNWFSGGGGLFD